MPLRGAGQTLDMRDVRLGHGVSIPAGLAPEAAFAAGLEAWADVLPRSAAFTSLTAARAHGLWLPPLPGRTPWFIEMARDRHESVPVRPELHVTRPATLPALDGRLMPVPETLLACARDCALLDVVVLVDSALHLGLVGADALDEVAGRRRRGAPRLRQALALADGRSESPWESLLRVLHVTAGIDVEPQAVIVDAAGRFVARADLLLTGTRTLHEYDGPDHRTPDGQARDLGRDRRLLSAGHVRRGFVAKDLTRHPQLVIEEACQAVGVPFSVDRVMPWLVMVADSLFSPSGTRAAVKRWLRAETVGRNARQLRRMG